jgi:periplasmic protein TonB
VIQGPSFAVRAILASAAVHVSVAVAISQESGRGIDTGTSGQTVELYTVETLADPTFVPPPPEEPPPPPVLDPLPNNAIPAAHPPAMVARPDSAPRGKPAAAPGPGPAGSGTPPVAEAPAIAASSNAPAHFVMSFGSGAATYGSVSAASGAGGVGGGGGGTSDGETYAESGVSRPARLRVGPPPDYPATARAEGVEADVPLEIVVNAAGAVIEARALRHAGYGMDEAALSAVRAYTFTPAQREGRNVRVRMRWVVQFRIQ